MGGRFATRWWSLRLPDEWSGEEGEVCSFMKTNGVGGLQISSHRKKGGTVAVSDLREFASHNCPAGVELQEVGFGDFRGLGFEYNDGAKYIQSWWLAGKRVMLFVTYNSRAADCGAELAELQEILSSLKVKG